MEYTSRQEVWGVLDAPTGAARARGRRLCAPQTSRGERLGVAEAMALTHPGPPRRRSARTGAHSRLRQGGAEEPRRAQVPIAAGSVKPRSPQDLEPTMRCLTFTLLFAAACASRAPEMPRIPERSVSFSIDQPLVKLPCAWPVGATYRYTYERRREDAQVSDLGAATGQAAMSCGPCTCAYCPTGCMIRAAVTRSSLEMPATNSAT